MTKIPPFDSLRMPKGQLFPDHDEDTHMYSQYFVQVLDLGFNLLRSVPRDAFAGITSLTLLALDGNPMSTVPEEAFLHLNGSLKGLSLGGRFLTCDCRMAWVPRWISQYDLQVTNTSFQNRVYIVHV